MNYSSFCDYLFAALMNQLEPGTSITKETVRKNNHVFLDAFIIRIPGSVSAPVIYLESLYENYKNGSSIDKIARMVTARVHAELPLSTELVQNIHSLDVMREKIAFRLISRKQNEALLSDVPWVPYLDLAIIFFLHLGGDEDTQITSLIHNQQAKTWNLSPKDLYALAKMNTPKLYPYRLGRMEQLALGWNEDESQSVPCIPDFPSIFILSNQIGIHGASCILYENILKDFADQMEADLIILPSSIHEVLILTDDHMHPYETYRTIIQQVNTEEVSTEDILSDELYLYRRGTTDIIKWTPYAYDNAEPCGKENL